MASGRIANAKTFKRKRSIDARHFGRGPTVSFGTLPSPPGSNHLTKTPLTEPGFIRLRALLSLTMLSLTVLGCDTREPVAATAHFTAVSTKPSGRASETRTAIARERRAGALALRLVEIDGAVRRWRRAPDLRVAHAAAEEARNLVVGPAGPYYGDADRDGAVAGASSIGLLPGLAGEAGLAQATDGPCVVRDILGGGWEQPVRRWSVLKAAIEAWSAARNTFPGLPSHPQRVVGWAALTLTSRNLMTARDYGKHAQLHIDVSRAALIACKP